MENKKRGYNEDRSVQYKARLTKEEENMLDYVCGATGISRSDIMRNALKDYNAKVQWLESLNDEMDIDSDHISLKRVVECPYCGEKVRIDLQDMSDQVYNERQMGPEALYEFDFKDVCSHCKKVFRVNGYISEYPIGALNDENISVIDIEEN